MSAKKQKNGFKEGMEKDMFYWKKIISSIFLEKSSDSKAVEVISETKMQIDTEKYRLTIEKKF